jgi:D-glycero-D-manno-heptose 1,7-bisphosphate phosphatase
VSEGVAQVQAVFLDRDGVLSRAFVRGGRPFPPRRMAELELLPGAVEACRTLKQAGFKLVMVTNQPDVARGLVTAEEVAAMNNRVAAELQLDLVRVCPHDEQEGCACRKPRPGMLVSAAEELGVRLGGSVMVGDRWRDVESGRRAGCWTVFIDQGYAERQPEWFDLRVTSLPESVEWILSKQGTTR